MGLEAVLVGAPGYGGLFTTSDPARQLPFVLPGERVATSTSKVLKASPDRVEPACVHFGRCGGCQYQHAAYSAQLALKRWVLTGILTDAGLRELPEIRLESAEEYGYRNRIRLRIEPAADGGYAAGYSLRATNAFLPIRMCPIAAPLLWRTAEAVLALAHTDALVRRWLAITSELEILTTPGETRLQLAFFLRSGRGAQQEASSFAGLCERLRVVIPELVGAGASLDPELNRRERRAWAGTGWGADGMLYPAAGREYWVGRGAFFQVNRLLVDRLVSLVTDDAQGDLAWDLYAGVGLFTRALAERFSRVVAVEGAAPAVASLGAAARVSQGRIEAVHAAAVDFLRARQHDRERPSTIVLDPPRAGLGIEGSAMLNRIGARAMVYVSCDPTTLARDLAVLQNGYAVERMTLIDLFPQTFHIETIVHLRRR